MHHRSHNLTRPELEDAQSPPSVDLPPGGIKIMEAMKRLLEEKSFDMITTAEIARTASVNEALIYRYFKDKRGLLHRLLYEYFREHMREIREDVERTKGSLGKLKELIRGTIAFHKRHRVFSKIMLLEVRNNPGYFASEAYELVRRHSELIVEILEQGARTGEIRVDLPASCLRDLILGGIEHVCMKAVVFNRELDDELQSHNLWRAIIFGLVGPRSDCISEARPGLLEEGENHGPQS